jgi:hypothetical protein
MTSAAPKPAGGLVKAATPDKIRRQAKAVVASAKSAPRAITMRAALEDKALLGEILVGPSWEAWRVLLIAAWGEALTDEERVIYTRLTGRSSEPLQRCEELVAIVGRRGGKSRAIAAMIVFIACFVDHSSVLAVGERGTVLCLAPTARQAGVVLDYVVGILESTPLLSGTIRSKTADSISLSNGIEIAIRPASFRGVRGVTCVAVVCDEAAFFFSEDTGSSNPDSAILDALRPSLATTQGIMAVISSPYARRGAVFEAFDRHYGEKGDSLVLVAKGASRDFNPSLPQKIVDRAYEKDSASAAAEYGGEFRSDLEAFLNLDAIAPCILNGVREIPPAGRDFVAFSDAAGGSGGGDSMTLAVAYRDGDGAVLAALREVRPPFSPEATVEEFASVLRAYSVTTVHGDRWGSQFVQEQWRRRGFTYRESDKTRSDLYLELLPLISSRRVALLDDRKLIQQLVSLERRTARSGRDSIDHPPNQHDDLANSAAGALVFAIGRRRQELFWG